MTGIAIFMIVQLLYIIRHIRLFEYHTKNQSQLKLIISIVSGLLIFSFNGYFIYYLWKILVQKGLFIPVLIYSIIISISLYIAILIFIYNKKYKTNTLFILSGMSFFYISDLNIIISLLFKGDYFTSYTRILIWIFYMPAILFLALSGYNWTYSSTSCRWCFEKPEIFV